MDGKKTLGQSSVVGLAMLAITCLGACGGSAEGGSEATIGVVASAEVPPEAANVENPVEATGDSILGGQEIYAGNCRVCHGENGEGDGPGAFGLDPEPANLNDRVPGRTDGELFWIVTNGSEGTAMPGWEGTLSEDDRWNVVNYLRESFG